MQGSPPIKGSSTADPPMYPSGFQSEQPSDWTTPPEQAEQSEAADNRPLIERLEDKTWKTRKQAYKDLEKLFSASDVSAFEQYGPHLPKIAKEKNASALDSGLDAMLAFFVNNNDCGSLPEQIAPLLIKSSFAGRPAVVEKGKQVILNGLPANAMGYDPVITSLLSGLKDKKPKIPPACVACLTEALKMFGAVKMPVADIIQKLPELFGAAAAVKDEAKKLMVEVYRWTGPKPLAQCMGSLRSAQLTEMNKAFDEITPGQAVPTYGSANKPVSSSSASSSAGSAANADASAPASPSAAKPSSPPTIDQREFVKEVNLLAQLAKTDFASAVEHKKWTERKRGLDQVLRVLKTIGPVPKLAGSGSSHGDLVSTIRKLYTTDSNQQVTIAAVNAVGAIADGLRREFHMYGKATTLELLPKLKEKKLAMVTAVHGALDRIYPQAVSLDQIIGDLAEAVDHKRNKVSVMRVQVLTWLVRCVRSAASKEAPLDASTLKHVVKLIVGCAGEDNDASVRKVGVEGIAAVLVGWPESATGGGALGSIVKSASKTLLEKAQAMKDCPNATVTTDGSDTKGKSDAPTSPPKDKQKQKPAGRPSAKSRRPSATSSRSGDKEAKRQAEGRADDGGAATAEMMSPEAALEQLQGLHLTAEIDKPGADPMGELPPEKVSAEALPLLDSAKWQERRDAILAMKAALQGRADALQYAEAVAVTMREKTRQFKESNFNIILAVLEVATALADATSADSAPFPKNVALTLVNMAVSKLGDRKASKSAATLLLSLAEAVGPAFVVKRGAAALGSVKAPSALEEALKWLVTMVVDFGAKQLPCAAICDHAKGAQGLESSNPKVRAAATALLGKMFEQMGEPLREMVLAGSLKPALQKTVEVEFDKVGYDASAAQRCARTVKAAVVEDVVTSEARMDISVDLKKLMPDLGASGDKTAWKTRAAALEKIMALCDAAGRSIEAKGTAELMRGLKLRLKDTNQNLRIRAAGVIGVVVASVGPKSAKLARFGADELTLCLGDNKKALRDATTAALDAWVTHGGQTSLSCVEALLPFLPPAMNLAPARTDVLGWMNKHLGGAEVQTGLKAAIPQRKAHVEALIGPAIGCLQDNKSLVRELAQAALVQCVAIVGRAAAEHALEQANVKPAKLRTITPILEKVYEKAEAAGAATAADARVEDATKKHASPAKNSKEEGQEEASKPATSTLTSSRRHSKRSSSPKKPTGKSSSRASAPAGAAAASEESDASGSDAPAFRAHNGKAKRGDMYRRNPWSNPDVTAAMKSGLREAWAPYLHPDLPSKLFSAEQKVLVGVLGELTTAVLALPDATEDCLDFLLKWATIQLCNNNVQVLTATASFLHCLFTMLKAKDYSMCEFEADIFVPFLVEQLGNNKQRFRDLFQAILKLVGGVLTGKQLMPFMLSGLHCRNVRSRATCLEEVGSLVDRNGLSVLGKKGLQEVSRHANASEKGVRDAGVHAIFVAYLKLGCDLERLYKIIGKECNDKVKAMVNEKIKHHKPEVGKAKAGAKATDTMVSSIPSTATPTPATSATLSASVSTSAGNSKGKSVAFADAPSYSDGTPAAPPMTPRMPVTTYSATGTPGLKITVGDTTPEGCSPGAATPATPVDENPFQFNDQNIVIPKGTPTAFSSSGNVQHTPAKADPATPLSHPSVEKAEKGEQPEEDDGVLIPAEAEANFAKVLANLDELLNLYCASPGTTSVDMATSSSVSTVSQSPVYLRGRDALKILHMMATSAGRKEKEGADSSGSSSSSSSSNAVEIKLLNRNIDSLLDKVTACVRCAFSDTPACGAASSDRKAIDINLLALALAVLYAQLQKGEIVKGVSVQTVQGMLSEVVHRLLDPHLADKEGLYAASAEKLIGAMNMVVLQAVDMIERSAVFAAGLGLLQPQHAHAQEPGDELQHKRLTKLYVRLFKKVLKKELGLKPPQQPFTALDIPTVLSAAHAFFAACCSSDAGAGVDEAMAAHMHSEDSPLRAVNTLISELVQALPSSAMRTAMRTLRVAADSQLFAVVAQHEVRYGAASPISPGSSRSSRNNNNSSTSTTPSAATVTTSSASAMEVQAELGQIFQRISASGLTSSGSSTTLSDSSGSGSSNGAFQLTELHAFKMRHPELDVLAMLPPCSAAFKDFLRKELQKMDMNIFSDPGTTSSNAKTGSSSSSNTSSGAKTSGLNDMGESKENSQPVDAIGERLRNLQARLKMNPMSVNVPLASSTNTALPKTTMPVAAAATAPSGAKVDSGKINIQNLKQRLEKLKSGQPLS